MSRPTALCSKAAQKRLSPELRFYKFQISDRHCWKKKLLKRGQRDCTGGHFNEEPRHLQTCWWPHDLHSITHFLYLITTEHIYAYCTAIRIALLDALKRHFRCYSIKMIIIFTLRYKIELNIPSLKTQDKYSFLHEAVKRTTQICIVMFLWQWVAFEIMLFENYLLLQ